MVCRPAPTPPAAASSCAATGETVPAPPNALRAAEKTARLAELNSDRFAAQTPYEIYPRLLDEGRYLGSIRTM